MRKLLIGAGACLTVGTFIAAERLTTASVEGAAIEQQAAIDAAVESQLTKTKAKFATETAILKDAKIAAEGQLASLNGTIADLTSERDALAAEVSEAEGLAQNITAKLSEIEALNSGMAERVELQKASLTEKDAELEALRTQVEEFALKAEKATSEEDAATAELAAEIASLSETLKNREETIASLEKSLEVQASQTADDQPEFADAELLAELESAKAQIAKLTESAAQQAKITKIRITELTEDLLDRDLEFALLEASKNEQPEVAEVEVVEEEPSEVAIENSEEFEALSAQVAELTELVSTQTETISFLRMGFEDGEASAMEMAEACIERANKIFEISQIKFSTGTTTISKDSMTTLEHLRDLAIGCESDDMFIEIGGHTDSYGAEQDNQRLSEARAATVRDFLIGRGIPAETMVAVGFGETQPIASNDTAEGRAENRRITFTWQMREDDETDNNADG